MQSSTGTSNSRSNTKATTRKWPYIFIFFFLTIGLILTILSWLHLCSEACVAGHKYRLYGFTFESIGFAFFTTTLIAHTLAKKIPQFEYLVAMLVSGAVGAEIMFIYSQFYITGHLCPICLSIAICVILTFGVIAYEYFQNLTNILSKPNKGEIMKSFSRGIATIAIMVFGFMFSMQGFSKFNALQAVEKSLKDSIAFGNLESPIEVFVFTDWECPSCRKIEPIIEKSAPDIMKKAKLIFVDYVVHDESLNFTPYNLSFMIHNKPQYMRLRDILTNMSESTKAPTDEQVEAAAKKLGVKYQQLNYSDVATGMKYFQHLGKQFEIEGTPTVVIVNANQKKGKKLTGASEITEKNITAAIDSFK